MQNKWVGYKRKLLELQDTLNKNPIQDAFIATATEILLALLEDKVNEQPDNEWLLKALIKASTENAEGGLKEFIKKLNENDGVKLVIDDDVSAHTEISNE